MGPWMCEDQDSQGNVARHAHMSWIMHMCGGQPRFSWPAQSSCWATVVMSVLSQPQPPNVRKLLGSRPFATPMLGWLQDLERTQQERSAEFAWLAHGFAEVRVV